MTLGKFKMTVDDTALLANNENYLERAPEEVSKE